MYIYAATIEKKITCNTVWTWSNRAATISCDNNATTNSPSFDLGMCDAIPFDGPAISTGCPVKKQDTGTQGIWRSEIFGNRTSRCAAYHCKCSCENVNWKGRLYKLKQFLSVEIRWLCDDCEFVSLIQLQILKSLSSQWEKWDID